MASSYEGCSTRRKGGVEKLDAHILTGIFSRLPPISLAYCSVVCSSWHSIITASTSLWRSSYVLEYARANSSRETPDLDWRACYIDQEQKSRLAFGSVSVRSWKAHSGRVNCCRMDLGHIISGSSDQTIRVWCAKTLKCVEQYRVPKHAAVIQIEFDESKVIGAAGKELLVWSRRGNRRLLRHMGGHSDICSMCCADADLAAGCADGTVRSFDMYSGRCTQIFRLHAEPVKALVMDTTTQSMASGSSDGTIQLFDARSGQKIASLLRPSMAGITCMHISSTVHKLFAGSLDGDLYSFDLRTRKQVWKRRVPRGGVTCLHSPCYSTSMIAVGGVSGAVNVFEVNSEMRIATFEAKPPCLPSSTILGIALGMTKLVSCRADSSMTLWNFNRAMAVPPGTLRGYGRRELLELP